MERTLTVGADDTLELGWNEVTGALGDAATVLPVVVAVAALTEFSLAVMLLWFGVFQIVWGVYYGVPMSVEPMKALAALAVAGSVSTGELVAAGLLLATVLLVVGTSRTLATVQEYVGTAVIRGIQVGVALVLLEAGVGLAVENLFVGGLAVAVAAATLLVGRPRVSALAVFLTGSVVVFLRSGLPSPGLPPLEAVYLLQTVDLTAAAAGASVAQLGMTIGNAALATAMLLDVYFDRSISADELSTSMGAMNAVAVPFGGFPMCHGSGGVAGKYAFGARTAGANLLLGVAYVAVAVLAVGLVAAFPTAALGVILGLIALQLAYTGLSDAEDYLFVVAIGIVGVLVNLAVAFLGGILVHQVWTRR